MAPELDPQRRGAHAPAWRPRRVTTTRGLRRAGRCRNRSVLVRDSPADQGRVAGGWPPVKRRGSAALALRGLRTGNGVARQAVTKQELPRGCAVEELGGRRVPGDRPDCHDGCSFRSARRGEDERGVVVENAAVAGYQDKLVPGDLPLPGLAAGLDANPGARCWHYGAWLVRFAGAPGLPGLPERCRMVAAARSGTWRPSPAWLTAPGHGRGPGSAAARYRRRRRRHPGGDHRGPGRPGTAALAGPVRRLVRGDRAERGSPPAPGDDAWAAAGGVSRCRPRAGGAGGSRGRGPACPGGGRDAGAGPAGSGAGLLLAGAHPCRGRAGTRDHRRGRQGPAASGSRRAGTTARLMYRTREGGTGNARPQQNPPGWTQR